MILTLILSALAGAAVPLIQPKLADFLATSVAEEDMPSDAAQAVLSFGIALLAASLILALSRMNAAPLLVLLGGLLGYFWKEIREILLNREG